MGKRQDATRVLVVGAGPVGLTLAMDLASRGTSRDRGGNALRRRAAEREMQPRLGAFDGDLPAAGLAQKLRDAGLPADYPNDCSYRTTATGIELSRIPIPCRRDRYTASGGPDTWWPTAEPPHRINQIYMEPVLFAHAAAMTGFTILNRTAFEDFSEQRRRHRCDGPQSR